MQVSAATSFRQQKYSLTSKISPKATGTTLPCTTKIVGEMEAVYISGCIVYMWCVNLFQPTAFLTLISRLGKVIYEDKYNKK